MNHSEHWRGSCSAVHQHNTPKPVFLHTPMGHPTELGMVQGTWGQSSWDHSCPRRYQHRRAVGPLTPLLCYLQTQLRAHASRFCSAGVRMQPDSISCKQHIDGISICPLLDSSMQGSAFHLCVAPELTVLPSGTIRFQSSILLWMQAASMARAGGTPSTGGSQPVERRGSAL